MFIDRNDLPSLAWLLVTIIFLTPEPKKDMFAQRVFRASLQE
jgi:hypothetical protein